MNATFPATMAGLAEATNFFEHTLVTAGCPLKAKTQLMIAIDEIASNIVRYSGAPDFLVEIDFPSDPDQVRISFSDSGSPFNPLSTAAPDTSLSAGEREIGGLGLFMVKKMMDNVAYSNENGRNILTISKLRG